MGSTRIIFSNLSLQYIYFLGSYFLAFRVRGSWAIPPFLLGSNFLLISEFIFSGFLFFDFQGHHSCRGLAVKRVMRSSFLFMGSYFLSGFFIFFAGFFIFWTFVTYGSF
jgi:hypothetical protein